MDTTNPGRLSYIPRTAVLVGLVGAITFMVFIANFLFDWTSKYDLMLFLIPLPFANLFLAWKKPFIGGILLIILGIVALLLDIYLPIGTVGYVSGLGLGYTLVFVTFPLLISGALFLICSWRKIVCYWRNAR